MELSQKSTLDRYIDRFPQETETYITHCLVGESDLSPADAESAIESLLIGEGGVGLSPRLIATYFGSGNRLLNGCVSAVATAIRFGRSTITGRTSTSVGDLPDMLLMARPTL